MTKTLTLAALHEQLIGCLLGVLVLLYVFAGKIPCPNGFQPTRGEIRGNTPQTESGQVARLGVMC